MKKLLLMLSFTLLGVVHGAEKKPVTPMPDIFYVYKDAGSRLNHYIPSGWMGAYRALKLSSMWKDNPKSGTCLKVAYSVTKDTETAWAGIYWMHPVDNWGNKKGGYDLSVYHKLKFWARGSGFIQKFMMGGITGATEEGDSGEAYLEGIDLTKEWRDRFNRNRLDPYYRGVWFCHRRRVQPVGR